MSQQIQQKDLYIQYQILLTEHPKLRARDAAQQLGVSEAQLLFATIGHEQTIVLKPLFKEILTLVSNLGPVMALTRNEAAVSEITGTYTNTDFSGYAGLVLNTPGIDLRIFFDTWAFGFATDVKTGHGNRHCLQFFDLYGEAIHKIYLTNKSHIATYKEIIEKFGQQKPILPLQIKTKSPASQTKKPNKTQLTDLQKKEFLIAWGNMQDTHDFFPLLKKHSVDRLDALFLAKGKFTRQVANSSLEKVLHYASEFQLPIMAFIGNRGMIQIWGGLVSHIKKIDSWLNVLDPTFNLHLRTDLIASSWVIEKPTADGTVTSLELYDHAGETIGLFFGLRKPGKPELSAWKDCLATLSSI